MEPNPLKYTYNARAGGIKEPHEHEQYTNIMSLNADAMQIIMPFTEPDEHGFWRLRTILCWVSKSWRLAALHTFASAAWHAPYDKRALDFRLSVPALRKCGDWSAILVGLRTFRSRASAQEVALDALRRMAETGSVARQMIDAGVFEAVVSALRASGNPSLHNSKNICSRLRGCVRLVILLLDNVLRGGVERAAAAGVYEILPLIMQQNPTHSSLHLESLEVLQRGSAHVGAAGINAVKTVMLVKHKHELVAGRIWLVGMSLLCTMSAVEHTHVVHAGGVELALQALRLRLADTKRPRSTQVYSHVQIRACELLGRLAGGGVGTDDQVTQIIADGGGITLIVALMLDAPRLDALTQQAGCVALGCIGHSDTVLQQRIVDAGGIAALERAVDVSTDPDVGAARRWIADMPSINAWKARCWSSFDAAAPTRTCRRSGVRMLCKLLAGTTELEDLCDSD